MSVQVIGQGSRPSGVIEQKEKTVAERVFHAVTDLFNQLKEIVLVCWNALVEIIQSSWNATTFLFFRTLDFISPSLSSKLERGYLYAVNLFQEWRAARNEEGLKAQNEELQARYNLLKIRFNQMAEENRDLQEKSQELEVTKLAKNHLEENLESARQKEIGFRETINRLQEDLNHERTLHRATVKSYTAALAENVNLRNQIAGMQISFSGEGGSNPLGLSPASYTTLQRLMNL